VGAPAQVKSKLEGMARTLQVEELMVLTVIHDHEARLRSYELLAESFGVAKRLERKVLGVAK
jgi:alkanesulfonate monooxygenase SsuD/methylene tetrahydromethanopterin reductase-like flavin-dependent oxidoreductase (luciferase family)